MTDEINIDFADNSFPVKSCISLLDLRCLENKLCCREDLQGLSELLSEEEEQILNKFSFKKRRVQWFGGRIATKHAVSRLIYPEIETGHTRYSTMSVLPAQSGRPTLSWTKKSGIRLPSISLSHSEHFAVAIAAETDSCGIDIQKITNRIHNVRHKFAAKDEEIILQNNSRSLDNTEQLTLLWAAKEAIKKGILHEQPTFFSGIELQNLSEKDLYLLQFSVLAPDKCRVEVEVQALQMGEFVMAFTWGTQKNA